MSGAARGRPAVFSALIVAGLVVTVLVLVVGRNVVTEALAALYLLLFVLAILRQGGAQAP